MNFPELETDRLLMKILTMNYKNEVFELFSDEHITQYMDIEPCKDMAEAEEIIQFHLDDTGCRWGIFEKETSEFMGTCGFHLWEKGERSRAEIGFDLHKRFWGKGYMQEAVKKLAEFGFSEMELDMIDATVETENSRSIALLSRLGFEKSPELKDGLYYFYVTK